MESIEHEFYNMCPNSTTENGTFGICNYTTEFKNAGVLHNMVSKIVTILFSIIGIVGVVANGLVGFVMAANPRLWTTPNILIMNLAFADFLFLLFGIPFTIIDYVRPRWPFGDKWCKITQYSIVVAEYASVYTLIFMSLDRFMAVVFSVQTIPIRNEKNAFYAISCLWVIILILSIPIVFYYGERDYNYFHKNYSSCLFLDQDFRQEESYKLGYQVFLFLSSYLIPLTVIIILYIFMLKTLWKTIPGRRLSAESRKMKTKVTTMVVIVVVVFAVCWFPLQIIQLMKASNRYNIYKFTVTDQIAAQALAYMNSCINPVVYGFMSENFKVAFKKLIYCPP